MYAVLKRHRITPDITITDHTVLRTLDPSALSRVFSNLLNNAVKYSDGDLSITLSEDGIITFSNTAAALSVVLNRETPKMRPVLGFHCTDTGGADARADGCLL